MLTSIFYAFLILLIINSCYLIIFGRFAFSKEKKSSTTHFNNPVSVIICAKNEAENLKKHIPYFINQNYPKFELVLVNDGSTDNSLEIIESFAEKHWFIKVVNVIPNEQFWGSKKYALTLGIKAAKYNYLLLSDADCKPKSEMWITTMCNQFTEEKQLILGYGAYQKIKNSFLNKLIRYETVLTALQYFSYLKIGLPYMGVGRNIAYTKDLFFKHSGFVNHMHVRSGDDDLFVNSVATKKNTTYSCVKESHTISEPKTNFNDWLLQKKRHVSTAIYYKRKHKLLLGTYFLSRLLLPIIAIVLLIFTYKWLIITLLLGVYLFFKYLIIGVLAKKLEEKNLLFTAPILDFCLMCFQLFIFIENIYKKPSHW